MRIQCLLADFQERGIQLWADGDRLRYRAPAGVLTDEDQTKLREYKPELVQHLARVKGSPELKYLRPPASYTEIRERGGVFWLESDGPRAAGDRGAIPSDLLELIRLIRDDFTRYLLAVEVCICLRHKLTELGGVVDWPGFANVCWTGFVETIVKFEMQGVGYSFAVVSVGDYAAAKVELSQLVSDDWHILRTWTESLNNCLQDYCVTLGTSILKLTMRT